MGDEKSEDKGKDEKPKADAKKAAEKQPEAKNVKADDKGEKPPEPVEIDFDGLADRFVELSNVERGNYSNIGATAKFVYWLSHPVKGMAEQPHLFEEGQPDATLTSYDLEKKKVKPFTEGVAGYAVALKADKLAVMKRKGDIFVFDAGPAAGDASDAKVKGGTGLGLNIAKGLVERMGGRIWFDTAVGAGTVFHFDFPLLPQ